MSDMMPDMDEDGYVYKGRAVAVEVVVHERFSLLRLMTLLAIFTTPNQFDS